MLLLAIAIRRLLGGFIGRSKDEMLSYVSDKVHHWINCVKLFSTPVVAAPYVHNLSMQFTSVLIYEIKYTCTCHYI